ncbi:MAG: DUF4240 domain-containing protein [Oscillospiraceae bacterium]|nr:DUF4240 domain-containing protein [Oscillospiraceae bacterium]
MEGIMDKFRFFWATMDLCDWSEEGNDDKVLAPVIDYLSRQDDSVIYHFDDLMSELLYHLDTKKLWIQCEKSEPLTSDDTFLYSRCTALINGPNYYEKARRGRAKAMWDKEFEALLYVPSRAWAKKHHRDPSDYDHFPPFSIETGSNRDAWA